MLKKYKNMLFTRIQDLGLNPSDFMASDELGVFKIKFINSPMYFRISRVGSNEMFDFEGVGFNKVRGDENKFHSAIQLAFDQVLTQFTEWLEKLGAYRIERRAPDLWAELQKQKTITDFTGQADDQFTPFTDEQKQQIRLGLNEVRLLIQQKFEPSEDEMKAVNARIDYVEKRLDYPKFDWKALLATTIVGIIADLSLNQDKAKIIWDFFKNMLAGVVPLLQ